MGDFFFLAFLLAYLNGLLVLQLQWVLMPRLVDCNLRNMRYDYVIKIIFAFIFLKSYVDVSKQNFLHHSYGFIQYF